MDKNKDIRQISIDNARKLKTDLVEATYLKNCSELEAKYRGRIFSISGKNKLFPKLPDDFFTTRLDVYPFLKGSKPLYCKKGKEIEFSNRPFIDDRSEKEKAEYAKRSK